MDLVPWFLKEQLNQMASTSALQLTVVALQFLQRQRLEKQVSLKVKIKSYNISKQRLEKQVYSKAEISKAGELQADIRKAGKFKDECYKITWVQMQRLEK